MNGEKAGALTTEEAERVTTAAPDFLFPHGAGRGGFPRVPGIQGLSRECRDDWVEGSSGTPGTAWELGTQGKVLWNFTESISVFYILK